MFWFGSFEGGSQIEQSSLIDVGTQACLRSGKDSTAVREGINVGQDMPPVDVNVTFPIVQRAGLVQLLLLRLYV